MDAEISFVESGTITSPSGFSAGGVWAGIKKKAPVILDLGMLYSEVPCSAAGLFTANRIKAAPVVVTKQRLPSDKIRAVVVNSGCANASVGETGFKDALRMAELAAGHIGAVPETVLVASTGVIGQRLPMELVEKGISKISVSRDGGHELARAIMTTDTVPKECAVTVSAGEKRFTIGGIAKGSGMIHPDLATLLCFLSTDAAVDMNFIRTCLEKAAAVSFNMVSIDGDTSPNDMMLMLANGQAGNEPVVEGGPLADSFQRALERVCIYLAKGIARDGEGANKLIEVTVNGALSNAEAGAAARTIAGSSLVKTAVYGNDPNWGRIVAALGRSGIEVVESKIDLYINGVYLVKSGCPEPFEKEAVAKLLAGSDVLIRLELNLGAGTATGWGCDLSEEYVVINSAYTT